MQCLPHAGQGLLRQSHRQRLDRLVATTPRPWLAKDIVGRYVLLSYERRTRRGKPEGQLA
ncbi:hypothetical protein KY338_06005 [Candidatus Woesearchaeota archaeon]|nr:hypothetical protein [Candidatus Woesearchaeota archaeon]MBW3005881.1 hypothetical protein [Candidatus Woesearchaeota archaeon]